MPVLAFNRVEGCVWSKLRCAVQCAVRRLSLSGCQHAERCSTITDMHMLLQLLRTEKTDQL